MRFAVVREPSETWSVLDRLFNLPAENDGRLLVGLTHDEARLERRTPYPAPSMAADKRRVKLVG